MKMFLESQYFYKTATFMKVFSFKAIYTISKLKVSTSKQSTTPAVCFSMAYATNNTKLNENTRSNEYIFQIF